MPKPTILWITGIPASGKTTLARRLVRHFRNLDQPAEIIDGDDVRKLISADLGFSKSDRLCNNRRIAWIARLLARNGVTAIVASVSPYLEGRKNARDEAQVEGISFIEIHTSCNISVARSRDIKKIYHESNVTGLTAPYETPTAAEIVVKTDLLGPDEALQMVLEALSRRS